MHAVPAVAGGRPPLLRAGDGEDLGRDAVRAVVLVEGLAVHLAVVHAHDLVGGRSRGVVCVVDLHDLAGAAVVLPPTRSAITVAGIVGIAANNSRMRGSNASTAA